MSESWGFSKGVLSFTFQSLAALETATSTVFFFVVGGGKKEEEKKRWGIVFVKKTIKWMNQVGGGTKF
jgi:hypothetical protein